MIGRWIDWCAATDPSSSQRLCRSCSPESGQCARALPEISDVQVIIHTAWDEPPNIVEDQITYPIVTSLLAAPQVKAVRAQTVFGDSYVFVVLVGGMITSTVYVLILVPVFFAMMKTRALQRGTLRRAGEEDVE